ncbi:MAG: hypothetical protein WBL85_11280 [Sedimentisphaerales bacterium]
MVNQKDLHKISQKPSPTTDNNSINRDYARTGKLKGLAKRGLVFRLPNSNGD